LLASISSIVLDCLWIIISKGYYPNGFVLPTSRFTKSSPQLPSPMSDG
jgi:hypothetical protein